MHFDLLIPSRGEKFPIANLLHSVVEQDVLPKHLVILIRKELTVAQFHDFSALVHEICGELIQDIILLHADYSDHEQGRGVGYDRNFLIKQAISPFLYTIDEDNVLPKSFFRLSCAVYEKIQQELDHGFLLSPTIMRAGKIQSQGITGFSYLVPKYYFGRCGKRAWHEVNMIGANSLFGPTKIFQNIQFDPVFIGSYEDIDFSSRVVAAGYSIVVIRDLHIDHQETKKPHLAQLFLATPQSAYYRSRNRIVRVKKTAKRRQKIAYFGCGLRIQTAYWCLQIFRSPATQKKALYTAIFRGIIAGCRY